MVDPPTTPNEVSRLLAGDVSIETPPKLSICSPTATPVCTSIFAFRADTLSEEGAKANVSVAPTDGCSWGGIAT